MHTKNKVTGTSKGIPVGLGLGLVVSLLITVGGAALTAWMIAAERIGEASVGYAVLTISILASALGALVSTWLIKRLRLQMCMLSGVLYYLSLLAITALLFGGQYQGMGGSAVAVLVGCAVIAFLPTKNGRTGLRKKRRYR